MPASAVMLAKYRKRVALTLASSCAASVSVPAPRLTISPSGIVLETLVWPALNAAPKVASPDSTVTTSRAPSCGTMRCTEDAVENDAVPDESRVSPAGRNTTSDAPGGTDAV